MRNPLIITFTSTDDDDDDDDDDDEDGETNGQDKVSSHAWKSL